MFDSLSDRLGGIFDKLKRSGALKEADVNEAMREVRIALLEADVALPVVKDFINKVREKAVGREVLKSVTPGQMVIKIVNDHLVEMLGGEGETISLAAPPPVPILMVGLQGSGKTTSTGKIAKRLQEKDKKKVLMASLDVRRPAAMEQLKILGEQAGVATLPIIPGQMPLDIAKRAMTAARLQGFDVVLLDTAGRLHVDQSLMSELTAIRNEINPHETLLVADALTGQDAVNVAQQFSEQVGLTGVVLTRMDGDGRGGAALSMRAVTGKPIKLVGVGEKLDDLEEFHPERVASRILGMGDVVSLVEKAAETIEAEEAEKMVKKMKKGQFDFNDLRSQIRQMKKLGGMSGVLGMLPGLGKMQKQLAAANVDDKLLARQEAIINSMTPKERANPALMNASRKKRIAQGAGVSVQDINKLMKMQKQMATMMKKMGKMGKKGRLPLPGQLPPGMENLFPK
ncbi:signal recognition particle protein [Luteithermobacter gelatinilyticus]|uniref:signal recognition particle protein n=1 Tax=Luteithermobacter gelatinilyticus TaxID=2582913 RepID=UPI0011072476|nr:signal recognition particle protein [Luteithermobacter gelatinilyticus]|tara:strand:+ start:10258 stop:11625 length:1368 start_codon:yes stop_codon:yes gene_type:complete